MAQHTAFDTAFEVEQQRLDREAQGQRDTVNTIFKVAAQDPVAGARLWNQTFGEQFGTIEFRGAGAKFDQFTLTDPDGGQRRFATRRGEDPPRLIELDIPGRPEVGRPGGDRLSDVRIKKFKSIQDTFEAIDPAQIVEGFTGAAVVPGGKKTSRQHLRQGLRDAGHSESDVRKISTAALKLKAQGVTNYLAKAVATIEEKELPEEFAEEPLREREGLFEDDTTGDEDIEVLEESAEAGDLLQRMFEAGKIEEWRLTDPASIDWAKQQVRKGR